MVYPDQPLPNSEGSKEDLSWQVMGEEEHQVRSGEFIPFSRLPLGLIPVGIRYAAQEAIENEQMIILLGAYPCTKEEMAEDPEAQAGFRIEVCTGGCCLFSPGCLIVMPDLMVLEVLARGQGLPSGAWTGERNDGRSVAYFPGPVRAGEDPDEFMKFLEIMIQEGLRERDQE
jgi:hypothetical protein